MAYKQIQWWLQNFQKGPFEELGGTMEHGIQRDSTSCAITTAKEKDVNKNLSFKNPLVNSLINPTRSIESAIPMLRRCTWRLFSCGWWMIRFGKKILVIGWREDNDSLRVFVVTQPYQNHFANDFGSDGISTRKSCLCMFSWVTIDWISKRN